MENGNGRRSASPIHERDDAFTKIDLHLHSNASGAATNWWVKGLGFGIETRESYTPPDQAYAMVKLAGMDFVTLTDHEAIRGAMTLADRPDFIVGEEVSAIFPEDGNHIDVLIFGLDRLSHAEAQARRGSVYELVDYLREAGLVHVLAHPLFNAGDPLDRNAIEKRLVLFGLWEYINGARPGEQNRLTREVAAEVGVLDLRQVAHRQGLPIPPHTAIAGTGGSDDHDGLYGGTTFTVVPRARDGHDLLAALAAGECWPSGDDGSVTKMAHTGFKIAGTAFAERGHQAGDTGAANPLLEYLPLLAMLDGEQIRSALVDRYEKRVADALNGSGGSPLLGILSSIGSFVDAHLFIAPYVGVHGYFGRESQKTRVLRRTLEPERALPLNVGIFVDDVEEVHGVATMYKNVHRLATDSQDHHVQLVHCGASSSPETTRLDPIAYVPMPLYEGRRIGVPSLLDVLDHVATEAYDVLHVATPGPLGLAAIIAGSTLGLPIVGAYHTEFGSYARVLSGDALVADIVEVLVREFYERCAVVAVPSTFTAGALKQRGYRINRFEVLKNGVDTELFHPGRRDEAHRLALGGGRTLLQYVGRVSREKGLEQLANRYLELRARRDDVHVVIAGDGPYRRELETMLGPTATFTGFLRGEDLARTFASCDIFAFPSTTDTLGRAVAEAQASGLPAVVYGMSGPEECIRPGISGFVVAPGGDAMFLARIEALLDDTALRRQMATAARDFARTLSWEGVLAGLIDIYQNVMRRSTAGELPPAPVEPQLVTA